MSNGLQKRLQKLERDRHPLMAVEDLLEWSDDENRVPLRYVPGENRLFDFLASLSSELTEVETMET